MRMVGQAGRVILDAGHLTGKTFVHELVQGAHCACYRQLLIPST